MRGKDKFVPDIRWFFICCIRLADIVPLRMMELLSAFLLFYFLNCDSSETSIKPTGKQLRAELTSHSKVTCLKRLVRWWKDCRTLEQGLP